MRWGKMIILIVINIIVMIVGIIYLSIMSDEVDNNYKYIEEVESKIDTKSIKVKNIECEIKNENGEWEEVKFDKF